MSFLSNAHNFQINGGEFHNIQNVHHGPSGIDILLAASTPDAAVDAEERRYAPSCFPGTRDQYIDDITNWGGATLNDYSPSIYWMKGPAGVGKSALAQTCAERLKMAGLLGAAYFFSVNGRDDHRRLFTTLAYQLSTDSQEYRQCLNDKIQNDKTLVKKTMSSQFEGLIVAPLQELEKQGKQVQRKAIFIDGLDECASKDAQAEIIRIIAASVQAKSTPFCWAIFSRPESQITTTFDDERMNAVSHCVDLPISRDTDQEIELYLRATFENMLRRRKLLHLANKWPTNEDIRKLVDASAGLFAYPAAVLRFIDQNSYSGFMERLQEVLDAVQQSHAQQPVSPFSALDAFYILVMRRIPADILPTVQLLLACVVDNPYGGIPAVLYCNILGLSQTGFRDIANALQAVTSFKEPPGLPTFNQNVQLTRSYFDQDPSFQPDQYLFLRLFGVLGRLDFYHKSFYDFLIDPLRSFDFCLTTAAVHEKLYDSYVRQQHHYAQSYSIEGTRLPSSSCVPSPSESLSWPHGSEFVDSFFEFLVFVEISRRLYSSHFFSSLQSLSRSLLRKLTRLDYRKSLTVDASLNTPYSYGNIRITGQDLKGTIRRLAHSQFDCIPVSQYDAFDHVVFLTRVKKLEDSGIIRPYHHRLPSVLASVYYFFSRLKASSRFSGQYKLGHGEKSVIWYWEFDEEKRYFHEFRTVKFLEARRIYKTEKFKIWRESWVPPS